MTEIVIYGANGATGSRFAEIAVQHGMRPVLAGRNRQALAAVAAPLGLEVRVATLDPDELDDVFADAEVVVSCVAPYTTNGIPVLEAAIRRRAHHLDCSGEPRYVLKLIEHYDALARNAGSAIIPSAGLGACANLVARTAACELDTVERITIDYWIRRMRPSWGTASSTVRLLAGGAAVLDRGMVRIRAAGSRVRKLENGSGVLFPLTDTLTCSRLWPTASIESYLRMPAAVAGAAAPVLALAGLAGRSRLVTDAIESAAQARRAAAAGTARGEFELTVTATGQGRTATAIGRVADVYEITSQSAFELARTVLEHRPAPGFRASGEIAGEPEEVAGRIGLQLLPTAGGVTRGLH